MGRPRVLYLVHQFGHRTGVELHTQTLARELSDRYELSIAWPSPDGLQLVQGSRHTGQFPADLVAWPQAPYRVERTSQSLAEIFRLVQPDIIHIQHFLNWPLGVIDQAVEFGAKVVVSFHDHFALSPNYALTGTETPQEISSCAYCMKMFGRDISAWLAERREVLRRSLERVHARVTVSPYVERQLSSLYPLSYQQIEYGITGFEPLPKSPARGGLRFGFLGQLVPMKGWESLVRGFAEVTREYPNVELHLYGGDRPDQLPGVTFHGPYESHDLARICSQLDIGVVPSVFAETHCMVLSEMWRGGLPVAVSDIGAMRDRVVDGVNGMKFQPGDLASIARALRWFIENDSWRSWNLPRPRLIPEMADEYDQLYQDVLARGSVPSTPTTHHDERVETPATLEDASRDQHRADDTLIVQTCGFLNDGDGVYRLHSPSRALSRLDGVTVVDCHPYHRCLPELQERADVLILSSFNEDIFPLIERRRAAGRVTVLEANDYYFDPQPWNTGATLWLNRSVEDWFSHLLRLCDGIQASTPELARRWRERTDRPVGIFPNQLTDIPPLSPARSRPITIGWGGSLGHLADWYQLAPGLQKWLDRNPDVHLAVMTNENARQFFRLPPERYHFQTFGTLAEFFQFLGRLDIGLAPLLPTDFNRCRSDVKFLEYASHGVIGVYADLEPYHDSIEHGRTGFLYRTEDELFACLDALVADARVRERIRQDAYSHVAQRRRLEDHISERLTFYRGLLDSARASVPASSQMTSATLSAAVRGLATVDGHYLQLPANHEPEQTLAEAIESPPTRDSITALARIVERHPDYSAALLQLGSLLNDQQENQAALPYLQRARQLNPQAAEPLCQLARIAHRSGQFQQAQQLLEKAIELNPYSPRAWRYLLRLLPVIAASLRRQEVEFDGRPWAERARQLHPASYSLALTGVALYPADEAIPLLQQLLDTHAPHLSPDDTAAVVLFSATISTIVGPHLARADVLQLARRAAFHFPQSVRLSDLLARALIEHGYRSEAHAEFARGQQLRRAAQIYRAEFPQEDDNIPLRLIAEHLRGPSED